MPLSKDLREFLALLNSNRVEYLVVGGFAVAHHGYPRYSAYLDLLVRPEPDNARRTLAAVRQFGFGDLGIQVEDLISPGKVIQLGVRPNRFDILTSISGVTFDEAGQARDQGELDGMPVSFIGRNALIRNKESTGRAKNIGDAEELKRRPPKEAQD